MNAPLLQPGGAGHACHWAGLACGALWVCLVALPLFAATSVVSVPLSDLCDLVPPTGADSDALVAILSRADPAGPGARRNALLDDALRRCMLVANGSFLNATAAGSALPAAFTPLRVSSRIPDGAAAALLAARNQTAAYVLASGA